MRICVIPDLHNKINVADYIINEEDAHVDEFVLLGDYFDDYNDTPEDNRETGLFINEFINNDKFKFLIGNHDLHYIINHAPYQCKNSYDEEKFNVINEVVSEDAWEKMVWTHIRDKWLFSHSGIIATDGVFDQEEHDGKLNLEIQNVIEANLPVSPKLGYGGTYWRRDCEDELPYAEAENFKYNQMYGHTVLAKWDCTQYVGYRAYNIDTHMQYYAVINTENDYVEIKRTNYTHRYWPLEVKWLQKTDQIKNL